MNDNVAAFAELGFSRGVTSPPATKLATPVMGQPISMPVLISPVGVQAVTRTARSPSPEPPRRGRGHRLSSFASKPIEEVIAANPQTFFQTYWAGGRDAIVARIERARSAGRSG